MNSSHQETLKELTPGIQRIAKIGGWELDVATQNTIWTDEDYRIYGIPIHH